MQSVHRGFLLDAAAIGSIDGEDREERRRAKPTTDTFIPKLGYHYIILRWNPITWIIMDVSVSHKI